MRKEIIIAFLVGLTIVGLVLTNNAPVGKGKDLDSKKVTSYTSKAPNNADRSNGPSQKSPIICPGSGYATKQVVDGVWCWTCDGISFIN